MAIRVSTQLRTVAERLLQAAVDKHDATKLPAAARVVERFSVVLTALLGAAGFRALLSRAVTLARIEARELGDLRVKADGSLDGLSAVEVGDGPRRFADGEVVLVAHLVGLLLTFVGEALMLSVAEDAWPMVRLDDLDFDDLDFDEGTKP